MDRFIDHIRKAFAPALFAALVVAVPARADVLYVLIAADNTIEKFTPDGLRSAFVTTEFDDLAGLAFDRAGNLYTSNRGNNTIEKFTPGGVGSVFARGLDNTLGLAFDSAGNLYASNAGSNTIEKFTPDGVGTVFAASGLNGPGALAFDRAGNLYVTNGGDNTIERFTPSGVGSVFASSGLYVPAGLAFDSAGNLYASNQFGNTIEKFTPEGVASVFASTGLNDPVGIAFDSAGNLYAGNFGTTIEKFTPEGVGSDFASLGSRSFTYLAFTNDAGVPLSLPVPEPTGLAMLCLGVPALLTLRRRNAKRPSRKAFDHLESLEDRTLLSAWSTVDRGTSINGGAILAMTTDASGDVFAVGNTTDANSVGTNFVREKPAGGSWGMLATVPGSAYGMALDTQGNLFITGSSNVAPYSFTTWELAKGSTMLLTIDSGSKASGEGRGLAFDAAGNLYAVGSEYAPVANSSHDQFLVRKGSYSGGKWSFSTVDELTNKLSVNDTAYSVVVGAGGVYVAGWHDYYWTVRASATGASGTWSTVDNFRLDSTLSAYSSAHAITVDSAGHLVVAGTGQTATRIGHTNSYHLTNYWLVRQSNTGAAGTWSTVDNSQSWPAPEAGGASAINRDAAGNMYVAGNAYVTSAGESGMVRVRFAATGSWSTSDIASVEDLYGALTSDPSGNVYAGGESGFTWSPTGAVDDYFIRSLPVAPTNLSASPDLAQPSSQINLSWTNAAGSDETGFAIYRSTDGVSFTLLGIVDASTTHYSDIGLAAGSTYFYCVVTLLNSDGSSAPSAAVRSTTSA